jgi:hypothetical protein
MGKNRVGLHDSLLGGLVPATAEARNELLHPCSYSYNSRTVTGQHKHYIKTYDAYQCKGETVRRRATRRRTERTEPQLKISK